MSRYECDFCGDDYRNCKCKEDLLMPCNDYPDDRTLFREKNERLTSERDNLKNNLDLTTSLLCGVLEEMRKNNNDFKLSHYFNVIPKLEFWWKLHKKQDERRLEDDLKKYSPAEIEIIKKLVNR